MTKIIHTTPFIDGRFTSLGVNENHTLLNPFDNSFLAEVGIGTSATITSAVGAAADAFPVWSSFTPEKRCALLFALASLIRRDAEKIATIECLNVGKVYTQCLGEVLRGAENIEFFATESLHPHDAVSYGEAKWQGKIVHTQSTTKRYPVGVVGQIVPWNSPFVLGTWNIAGALAYGNTVVLKPSLWAPLSLLYLGKLMQEVCIPFGVLNIVPGDVEASEALVRDKTVQRIAFTGSDKVGRLVQIANAETRFAPVSLELGGKSPNIVFEDVDLDEAVAGVALSFTRSQGESCVAGSRAIVERSIYQEFKTRLVEYVSKIKIGNPMEAGVEFGPLINQTHYTNVTKSIIQGLNDGAHIECGGLHHSDFPKGNFIEPTIFSCVIPSMNLFQEEIFGPVLSLTIFSGEGNAIFLANQTKYGLSANIWTKDITRAYRIADQINAGMIWINGHFVRDLHAPFGGMKASGVGRQGAGFTRDFYTEPKMVCNHW